MKYSLSAALKQKNRIAGELATLQNLLKRDNSRVDTKPLRSDLAAIILKIEDKTNDLLTIKTAIAVANIGVYADLARLEEAKAKIAFYQSLNTTEGKVETPNYGGSPSVANYVTFLNQGDVDSLIKKYQDVANQAQDDIDAYNATHFIEVTLS